MQIGKPKGTKTMVTSSDVLQTIIDLYQSNPPREATRKTISHELGVAFSLVDDHVDRLLERGKIRRALPVDAVRAWKLAQVDEIDAIAWVIWKLNGHE